MEEIRKKIEEIKEHLKNFPADANVYILLVSMNELIVPTHTMLLKDGSKESVAVARQIKLITDIANAIIEMLDIKNVSMEGV